MELVRIDLTAIVGIVFGGMALLIPIAGLTARLAILPIIQAVACARASQGSSRGTASLEVRLARLERHVEALARQAQSPRAAAEPEELLATIGI